MVANDIDVLARTLWGEARGEGPAGQVAVAWTIRNRVNDGNPRSWWGEGYAGVCQAPWQFSCWNKNDPNYPYLSGAKQIPPSQYALVMRNAKLVVDGATPDPTGGATHYYAKSMKTAPKWTVGAKQTVTIGNHVFFRDVP
ncbi:cell wall hydrolase [Pseudomonas sp. SJZ080]|uniref:cell wall hydrolase n=1 Tax=Pseudomonas sp. SJZ080 TaxID=2572888 RepID=UPI00119A994B|nr:cell wall hydrolase [Pseudomonas sp. SJZ080]TWC50130.1 cell wall hydrolase [Pseudomonas sp. SJZ080]